MKGKTRAVLFATLAATLTASLMGTDGIRAAESHHADREPLFTPVPVPGTGESVPSTEDMVFSVLVEPGTVEDIVFYPETGLSITPSADGGEGPLLVKIPRNFPMLTTRGDTTPHGTMVAVGGGQELPSTLTEDECFFSYEIAHQGASPIQLLSTYHPVGTPILVSHPVDDACLDRVFAAPPCEEWHNLRGDVVCVFGSSVEKLVQRGYLVRPAYGG